MLSVRPVDGDWLEHLELHVHRIVGSHDSDALSPAGARLKAMSLAMGHTPRAELRRWRQLAMAALSQFGIRRAEVSLVKCGENITYRVREPSRVLLLRIHRPVYHTAAEIRSELEWLRELDCATGLPIPTPLPARDGQLLVQVDADGEPHVCTLLRWVKGRQRFERLSALKLRALGTTMATLHRHALRWRPPNGFRRPKLDWTGLLSRESNWGRLPAGLPALFAREDRLAVRSALARIRAGMRRLDLLDGSRALIHADLHLGNVVFTQTQAAPIDFDDSGFGYLAYDLATTLIPFRESPRFPAVRDAMLEGYSRVRSFPPEQLALLPELFAARRLTMAIWLTTRQALIPRLPRDLAPYLSRTAAICRELDAGRR